MKWLRTLTEDTVIVHLTDSGPSIKGAMVAVHSDCLVLERALVLEPESQTLLSGDVVVPREQVAFIQRLDK